MKENLQRYNKKMKYRLKPPKYTQFLIKRKIIRIKIILTIILIIIILKTCKN